MKLNRDNYELFFIDYLEGQLEEDQIDQFLDFLEQNPDLKEELHLVQEIRLPAEKLVFSEKENLYKNVEDEQVALDNKIIAYLEGDLNDVESAAFKSYLGSDPEAQKELDLFKKTLLHEDQSIRYPKKQKLYRRTGSVIFLNYASRIAAVIVLVWGIQTFFQTFNQPGFDNHLSESVVVNPTLAPETGIEVPAKTIEQTVEPARTTGLASRGAINNVHKKTEIRNEPAQIIDAASNLIEREDLTLAELRPLAATIDQQQVELKLVVPESKVNPSEMVNSPVNLTIEEYLALRAQRLGNEGLNSVQRVIRFGLNVASEISGERIGYSLNNGKVASLEYASKLMAFSIPLEKK